MNNRIIPLVLLSVIFTIPAIAVQSVYAGIDGGFGSGPSAPQFTTIMPSHDSFGFGNAPIVYWGEPFMVTLNAGPSPEGMNLCNNVDDITSINVKLGPFSDNVFGGEGEFLGATIFFLQPAYAGPPPPEASQPMTEIDTVNGIWKANFPALLPLHGNAVISYTWTCESTGNTPQGPLEDGGIFMDPSGQVTNACTGDPIQNAEVTLFSDHFGPIFQAPFGSYIPAVNPLFTDVNGLYAWDVEPDFNYQVSVDATLLTGADQDYVSQLSGLLPVPPPQTGVNFALVPVDGCPAGIGGEIIPIETTTLLLAGAQSTSWLIPIVISVVGIGLVLVRRK